MLGKVIYMYREGNKVKREISDRDISIFDIASTFLSFEAMTHKKLQKLCYYAQAWYMALMNKPLVDAEFQAWIHGPVCPALYDKYKVHGWIDIEKEEVPDNIRQNEEIYEFLKQIYRIYGDLNGNELEMLTHSERPWQNARKGFKPWEPSTNPIRLEDMRDYYLEEYERSQND